MTVPGRAAPAPRPRVLHVMDSLAAGGMEQVLLGLVERTRDRFDHSICCIRDLGVCPDRPDRFAAAGAVVTFLGKAAGQDWSVPWRIARVCRALRPHIVHTRNWGTIEGTLTARLARVPVVIHGEHGRDVADGSAPNRRRDRVRRLLFPFVDRIVVVSKHLERWLLDEIGVQAHKAALIPNGVDTNRFRPAVDRHRLRRERGYEPGEVLIGAVGRLHSVKDYPTLISAFDTMLRRQPAARLVIVGEGPERTSLDEEIRRRRLQHAARLAGHRDDVREWLAAMDLFVQSSVMEGTSNALLEAMAVGLPAVATSVGGNPEVVVDGVTGRLVPTHDTTALAAAMELYVLSREARSRHGAAARERVARRYSMDDMIAGYTAVYRDTLACRGSRWLLA